MLTRSKFIIFLSVWIIYGCNNSKKKELHSPDDNLIKQFSLEHIGEKEYEAIYKSTSDSLKNWCDNNLSTVIELKTMGYELDSILCFNEKRDKFIGAILIPCTIINCKQDDIRYLYGVKIESNWYYFFGATIVLPQSQPERPRTFSALHEIALQKVFRGYLKKSSTGEWEINERFFSDFTSSAFNGDKRPYTKTQWDSVYLEISNPWKWGKIDDK